MPPRGARRATVPCYTAGEHSGRWSKAVQVARVDARNRARYWHDSELPGLSLLDADFTRHDYAPHRHDALVVAVTEIGGSEFHSRGCTEEARVGGLLVFNPTEPHSGRMGRSKRWRYRALYLTEAAIGRVADGLGLAAMSYFSTNLIEDAELARAFLGLHRALETPGDALRTRERLVGCFGALVRRHGGGRRVPDAPCDRTRLAAIVALMRDRHADRLTLDELAASVDLTPFQLIGLFNRAVGLTPHAHLIQIRLEAAMRQLRARRPIAEAALAAGFYDQSALTRHLKRAYGITPQQYVRATAG
jgi:AraC-like DNA-binding protein